MTLIHRDVIQCACALACIAASASAHEGDFVISRDDGNPPRLHVNGQSNLKDGAECITLMRGDGTLEGYWFSDAPGFATLRKDNDVRLRHRLLPGHRIALRMVHAESGFALLEPSTWKPVLTRDGDEYPFFLDPQGDFTIQMIPRVKDAGVYRVTFQFIDRAGLHKPSQPFVICFSAGQPTSQPVTSNRALAADGHYHGPARPFTQPLNYQQAIVDFRSRLHEIDASISTQNLSYVPAEADVIQKLAERIPALSLSSGSGVPPNFFGEYLSLSQLVSNQSILLTRSANWSDAIAVREYVQDLYRLLDLFEALVARRYLCPMRCEGEKTYAENGKCAVCHMRLADSRSHQDHQPKHGGIFFMAPDNMHHLEGVLVGGTEFRLYFYDEFTNPISAKKFSVRAEIRYSDRDEVKVIRMELGPTSDFLAGKLPTGEKRPIHIKLFVDFQDGAGPQVFDFDFQ